MKRLISIVFLLSPLFTMGQVTGDFTQVIKGTVTDQDSKYAIIGANVVLVGSDPVVGTITDLNGEFRLEDIPIGRQTVRISFIGYEDAYLSNLNVLSGKELDISIELVESIASLEEIVIVANEDQTVLNNEMALVSARSFDIEQTKRYAGAINDPSRMAANFAGVATNNDGRNDIIIRGNSPSGLLWRFEGLDIPSPNHYASAGATGGPVTMLNNNQLAKSDFLTAAFPAEYGNAISGVFDLKMRNGNSDNHEFLGQVAFNGFEFGAEGPLSKNGRSSYMINYRYSTLALARELGFDFGTGAAIPQFQDLSFKLNFPKKDRKISLFGIWGDSYIELLGSEQDLESEDLFGSETADIYNDNSLALLGGSYTKFLNENTFASLVLGISGVKSNTLIDTISFDNSGMPIAINRQQNLVNDELKYMAHLYLNKKFNSKNTVVTGVMADYQNYDFFEDYRIPNTNNFIITRQFDGGSTTFRGYVSWKHKFNERISLATGFNGMYHSYSQAAGFDPRIGIKYKTGERNGISFGYGLHHQLQPIPLYFQEELQSDDTSVPSNKDLDLVQSQHIVAGFDHQFSHSLRFKIETYYQWISQAGTDPFSSSFSTLNTGADFNIPDKNNLQNEGEGENIGLELTLEKFFSDGYYFLITSSFFDSRYAGSDGIWRNTAFNSNYILNALGGKEWTFGPNKNTLGFDIRLTTAGGRYVTPIDLEASNNAGYEIKDEANAYSEQLPDYFRMDVKFAYRMNRPKVTHEFAIDIQNITNRENAFQPVYNRRTGEVNIETQIGLFPVPLYRVYF